MNHAEFLECRQWFAGKSKFSSKGELQNGALKNELRSEKII